MTTYPLLPKDEYERIYSKVPKLCVEVVIENEQGVLFTLRTLPSWHGYWQLPGGTVRYQEPLKEAVKRVAKDELGVDVEIKKFIGYIQYSSDDEIMQRGFGYTVSLCFLCRPLSYKTIKYRKTSKLKNADLIMKNGFWIGVYPGLTKEMLNYTTAVIRDFLNKKL